MPGEVASATACHAGGCGSFSTHDIQISKKQRVSSPSSREYSWGEFEFRILCQLIHLIVLESCFWQLSFICTKVA